MIINDTNTATVSHTYSISETVTASDSVGVDLKVGGKIADLVNVEVTAKYITPSAVEKAGAPVSFRVVVTPKAPASSLTRVPGRGHIVFNL